MQKRRTALIAAICALVLFCVFAGSFLISSMSYQTDRFRVTLPGEAVSTEEIGENVVGEPQQDTLQTAELTPQNVQSVIAALERSEEYNSLVTSALFLSDETTAKWDARVSVKNRAQRVERLNAAGAASLISLYYEDMVYVWEPGSTAYWSGAAGSVTADMSAMIPSYEKVCALPVESITQAALQYVDGEPCIFVASGAEEAEYLISCVSGLLKQAKYYENGVLVREVSVTSLEDDVSDALFALPDAEDPIFARQ